MKAKMKPPPRRNSFDEGAQAPVEDGAEAETSTADENAASSENRLVKIASAITASEIGEK